MKKKAVRTLCLLLCTAMLFGLLPPVTVDATETSPQQTPSPEVSVPEETTAPTEETAAPTVEQTEETTAPTVAETVVEETIAPTVEVPENADGEDLPAEASREEEAPAAPQGITEAENGGYNFQTMEDLVELASRTYDNPYTPARYVGEGDLVITQSLTIPRNLSVNFDTATVAEGVTLTVGPGARFAGVSLTVAGTLDIDGGEANFTMAFNITGSVVLNGRIGMSQITEITGAENIRFVTESSELFREVGVSSLEGLKEIAAMAAEDTTPRIRYTTQFTPDNVTMTESMTLPDNMDLITYGNVTIPSGVTVTVGSVHAAINDWTVDGTLTANTLYVQDGTVFTVKGTVTVNGNADIRTGGGPSSTLNVIGSMSCGSMKIDLAHGSIAVPGELKIANFDSLEALGLDPNNYTATQGSDGFTLISQKSIVVDHRGNYLFRTLEDLAELTSRTYDIYTHAVYVGEEELVVTQDLTIPLNLCLSIGNATVAEGVTLTVEIGASLDADSLTVAGTLDIQGGNFRVIKTMNITGSVILDGVISLDESAEITGVENIRFVTESSGLARQMQAHSFEHLKELAAIAAQETNPRFFFVVNTAVDGITVTESITLPENMNYMYVYGDLIIPNGVTMTTAGCITVPPKYGQGGTIRVQSGGALVCGVLDTMNDCTVDGTLTANSLHVSYDSVFAANGTVTVNREVTVARYNNGPSTLDIFGSMSCGSMVVNLDNGSVSLTGELKLSSFSSLEALGLDANYYTVTQDSDGSTLISCKSSSTIKELDELVKDENATPEEIKDAVQGQTEELKEALSNPAIADTVADKISALEEKASGGPATVEVTQNQTQIDQNKASVVGATLNNVTDPTQGVRLVVDEAKQGNNQIGIQFDPDTAVTFSMTLANVENPSALSVPVRITLPVPNGIDVSTMKILHYNTDGSVKEEIPFVVNGDGTVSFVVTGFSDFAMVEEKTELGDVDGDGEITAMDAAWIYAFVNNKKQPTQEQALVSDVDGDGEILAMDAAFVYAYVNNKIKEFPAQQ